MRGYINLSQRLASVLCVFMLSFGFVRSASAESPALKEAVLEVRVNEQGNPESLIVLRDENNGILLEESDFARLRLKLPKVPVYSYEQRRYYSLNSIADIKLEIDEAKQSVTIHAPASAFLATQLTAESRGAPTLTPSANGAFLNYQLSTQRIADSTFNGVFTELGVFTRAGVLTTSSVARSQSGSANQNSDAQWIRLDTTFTHDFPSRIERLTIGDSISNAGSWGSALRFAGISWGTDFTLRPDLVTTPLLTATGTAVVPSTVDVFVNNQKVTSQVIPPGPFIIDRLPAITGSGQVSMVVRDALGREQVLTQAFYSNLNLLAPKLSEYQINVGRVRNNYALQSNDYGSWIGEATYRRGINSMLTVEGHGEVMQDFGHALGLNVAVGVGRYGIVNVIGAASSTNDNSGSLLGAAVESQWSRLNFILSSKAASRGYRQLTNAGIGYQQFRQRDLAQVGLNMSRAGSMALAYAHDSFYDLPSQRNLSLTYNASLGDRISLSLVASRSMTDTNSNSYFLTFTMPLGSEHSASLSANGGTGVGAPPNEVYATLIKNSPAGVGYGYRLSASTAKNYNVDGRVQTTAGDLDVQAARQQDVSGQSLYWSGAATLIGGELDFTRTVFDSFALIDVDGINDVPVYIDHQLITHTDKNGRALLHDLLPYQANRINVEPTELPLDTEIATRTLVIVPGYRSGVIAHFPVSHVRAATFRLITDADKVIPVGAQVRFNGKVFPVAYDGATYVTGYDHGMTGHVSWNDGECEFRVQPPPQNDPLPDLGDIKCHKLGAKPKPRPLQ